MTTPTTPLPPMEENLKSDRLTGTVQSLSESLSEWRKMLLDMTLQEDMKVKANAGGQGGKYRYVVKSKNQKDPITYSSSTMPRTSSQKKSSKVHKNSMRLHLERTKQGTSLKSKFQDYSSFVGSSVGSKSSQGTDTTLVTSNKSSYAPMKKNNESSNPSSRDVLMKSSKWSPRKKNLIEDFKYDEKRREPTQITTLSRERTVPKMTTYRKFATTEQKKKLSYVGSLLLSSKEVDTQSEMGKDLLSSKEVGTWSRTDKESARDDAVANREPISKTVVPLAEGGNETERELSAYNEANRMLKTDNCQPEKTVLGCQKHQEQEEPISKQLEKIAHGLKEYQEMRNVMLKQCSKSVDISKRASSAFFL